MNRPIGFYEFRYQRYGFPLAQRSSLVSRGDFRLRRRTRARNPISRLEGAGRRSAPQGRRTSVPPKCPLLAVHGELVEIDRGTGDRR